MRLKRSPGHCHSDKIWADMAEGYRGPRSAAWATDFEVAYEIAMTSRSDLNFEAKLGTAKDRIRWLSVQLAVALAERDEARATLGRIAAIEHGWNKPHRLTTARGLVEDCVGIARSALSRQGLADPEEAA